MEATSGNHVTNVEGGQKIILGPNYLKEPSKDTEMFPFVIEFMGI